MIQTKIIDAKVLIQDDPVRPLITAQRRCTDHFEMYHTGGIEEGTKEAAICIAFCNTVPKTEKQLLDSKPGDIAVFYTVWSYANKPGAGRDIVFKALDLAKERGMRKYVTMSPKTEMARRFHLRNGARLVSENEETNTFEY